MFANSHRLLPAVVDALEIRVRFCEPERPNGSFRAINLKLRPAAVGRSPAYTNSGWPATKFMQLGCQKPCTRHRLDVP
jgi:hypothetical protein